MILDRAKAHLLAVKAGLGDIFPDFGLGFGSMSEVQVGKFPFNEKNKLFKIKVIVFTISLSDNVAFPQTLYVRKETENGLSKDKVCIITHGDTMIVEIHKDCIIPDRVVLIQKKPSFQKKIFRIKH